MDEPYKRQQQQQKALIGLCRARAISGRVLFMMLVECIWSLKGNTNVLCIIPEPKQSLTSLIILPICFLWKWQARAI